MARHVIVVSEDALVYEDLETLKTLPNFSRIWDRTARVNRVRSVYPTITYPCHTTMMTGVYPDRHGVVNNEQPRLCEVSSPWIHFRESVKAPTVFDCAKAAGLTTAGAFWPVTGGDQSIDYLVAEYWPQSADESGYDCFVRSGSSAEVMKKVVAPNLPFVEGRHRRHPYCDQFVNACACAIVRAFKPNLLMVHPANVDAYRHHSGLFSPLVTHGLHQIDLWLGDLIAATRDAGIYDETDFVITSDHGQLNIVRTVSPNAMLAERGLIEVAADGSIGDYTAFCKSAAMSSHVYLKDPGDRDACRRTRELLKWMCAEGVYGISRVYTAEEVAREERLAGGFSFVLESDGYSSFTNEWTRPLVRPLDVGDYRFGRATHGHHPDKGPQPTMLCFGPDIRPGAVVERGRLVDQAPTIAALLGLKMENIDGAPIGALLR
ncbi:MAG: alkaline phosphatase family protein [Clostridiales bacterium]|nr:alkaline phosphatase family protein [Clostridiales bacterium]